MKHANMQTVIPSRKRKPTSVWSGIGFGDDHRTCPHSYPFVNRCLVYMLQETQCTHSEVRHNVKVCSFEVRHIVKVCSSQK
jgi:hypothetical protein